MEGTWRGKVDRRGGEKRRDWEGGVPGKSCSGPSRDKHGPAALRIGLITS